jgi:hypothetical protein
MDPVSGMPVTLRNGPYGLYVQLGEAVVKPKEGEVPGVEQQAALGQAVFDHLVNTLGALTRDLQPDAILLLQPDPLRGAQFRTIAAGGSGSIDPFLSSSSDLDLGVGVKIPLGFVLTPSSSRCAGCSACGSSRAACWPIRRVHRPRPVELGRGGRRVWPLGLTPASPVVQPRAARPGAGQPDVAVPRCPAPHRSPDVGQPGAGQRLPNLALSWRSGHERRARSGEREHDARGGVEKFRTGSSSGGVTRSRAASRPRRADHGDPPSRRRQGRPELAWRTTGSDSRSRRTASLSPPPRRSGTA